MSTDWVQRRLLPQHCILGPERVCCAIGRVSLIPTRSRDPRVLSGPLTTQPNLFLQAMEPMEASRKAFRLIGGVLVERTVGEVLPAVKKNRDNIMQILGSIKYVCRVEMLAAGSGRVGETAACTRPSSDRSGWRDNAASTHETYSAPSTHTLFLLILF